MVHVSLSNQQLKRKHATQRTIVSWHLAGGTASFKRNAANATHVTLFLVFVASGFSIFADVPSPLCDGVPMFDGDFHVNQMSLKEFRMFASVMASYVILIRFLRVQGTQEDGDNGPGRQLSCKTRTIPVDG